MTEHFHAVSRIADAYLSSVDSFIISHFLDKQKFFIFIVVEVLSFLGLGCLWVQEFLGLNYSLRVKIL